MCGLFGIYGTDALSNDDKDMFATLGIFSSPRGKDATGFLATETALYKRPGKSEPETMYIIHKQPVEPYEFFRMPDVKRELNSRNNCLMGHNRHATVGEKIAESAHPFEHGSIIGMHNGTIRGYASKEDYSDSDRLYKKIEEIGLRDALKELPRDSAYALTWWDMDSNEYCFFRNNQRPIVYTVSKDGKKIMWASEKRFILSCLAYHEEGDRWGDLALLKTNCLLRFSKNTTVGENFGKIKWVVATDFLEKAVIEKHESKSYVSTGYQGGHWNGSRYVSYNDSTGDDFWAEWDKQKADEKAAAEKAAKDKARTETSIVPAGTGATTGNLFVVGPTPDGSVKGGEKKVEEAAPPPEKEDNRPVEKEVTPVVSTFQYRPSSIRGQHNKRVSYTFWPLQSKVSRREMENSRSSLPSYVDYKPGDLEFDSEIINCKRFIHNANDGVFITIDNDDFDITVHLPSGKTKHIEVMDPRWNGWYVLKEQMDTEWERAATEAREKGNSNLNIRFYPWNAAHSFVSMNIGAYSEIDSEEDAEEPAPDPKTEVKEPEKPKRGRPSKADRAARALAESVSAIDVSDLEVLPWTEKDDSVIIPDWYEGFKREALSLEEAQEFLKSGCANCQGTFDINDRVYWHSHHSYFCNECVDLEVVQQHVDVRNLYLGQRKEA